MSVSVMSEKLGVATLEPWTPPNAPIDKLLKFGRWATTVNRSVEPILVEVRESFSRGILPRVGVGCRMCVNERSRRLRFTQTASIRFTVGSDSGVSRRSIVLSLDNEKLESMPSFNARHSLATVESVLCRV